MGIDIIPLLNNNNLCTRIKRFFFYFIYNQISLKKKKKKNVHLYGYPRLFPQPGHGKGDTEINLGRRWINA